MPPDPPAEHLLSARGAAEYLRQKIGLRFTGPMVTVRHRLGEIAGRAAGRRTLYSVADLDAYIAQAVAPGPDAPPAAPQAG